MYGQVIPESPRVDHQKLQNLVDRAQAALQTMEFCRAVLTAETLDDIFLLVTNDIRSLLPFDRAFLITHLGGKTRFVAAAGIVAPEKKAKFYREAGRLAKGLKCIDKSLFAAADQTTQLGEYGIEPEAQAALERFTAFSKCSHIFVLPLERMGVIIGHLVMEFMDDTNIDTIGIESVKQTAPAVAAALAEKWIRERLPTVAGLLSPENMSSAERRKSRLKKVGVISAALTALFAVLFLVPFQYTVGGEAEIVPGRHAFAFSRIEGLVAKVAVREGSEVKAGEILAVLDHKDIDFRILTLERESEMLGKEISILMDGAGGTQTAKLARAQLLELNRSKKLKELEFWRSQRAFLEIKSPVSGIVTTKNIESLSGKRFAAGEVFCEIAGRDHISVDIYTPDDRITRVRAAAPASLYLNSDPTHSIPLTVTEIAPKAEVTPRLGNIFRVRAQFAETPSTAKVGMKGIGKIHTGTSSLSGMIADRVMTRWNSFSGGL